VALVRNFIPHEIRIPAFVLIIAALVTVVELAMHAWVPALYMVLGVFIPLITTNCIVLARVEAFASKRSTAHSILDATMMGLGLTAVLVVLGGLREAIGKGTLFSGIDLALGPDRQGLGDSPGPRLPRLSAGHPAARRLHRPGSADRRCATGF
jgi:electron transport complex protein RnfE